jgi:hypothetical protein
VGARHHYLVRCKCGYEGSRRRDHVDSERSVCCKKCSAKQTASSHPNKFFAKRPHHGVGELTKTFWKTIKNGADVRDIDFEITLGFAWDLFESQDRRCALSGVPINLSSDLRKCNPDYSTFTASLDRKDSSLGYTEGNVQWIHKTLNRMKGTLPDEEFVKWCSLVTKNSE